MSITPLLGELTIEFYFLFIILGLIAIGSGYDRKVALADRLIGHVVRFALGLGGCNGQT